MKNTKNVRWCILALAICSALFCFGAKDASLTTEWIGHPMVSDNDQYTPSQGWIAGVEIGLRSDGVVVWRDATKLDQRKFSDFKLPEPLPTFGNTKKQ